jgi:hypothetical protein
MARVGSTERPGEFWVPDFDDAVRAERVIGSQLAVGTLAVVALLNGVLRRDAPQAPLLKGWQCRYAPTGAVRSDAEVYLYREGVRAGWRLNAGVHASEPILRGLEQIYHRYPVSGRSPEHLSFCVEADDLVVEWRCDQRQTPIQRSDR